MMAEEEVLFDDVYELQEVIGRSVPCVSFS